MARKRFTFWLDDTKTGQNQLIGLVESLKENRLFSKTIRQGLELVASLRDGNLDVLFAMFPWVRAEFLEYVQSLQPPEAEPSEEPVSTERRALQEERRQLEEARAALEQERRQLEQQRKQMRSEQERHLQPEVSSAIEQKLNRIEQFLMEQDKRALGQNSGGTNQLSGGLKPVAGGKSNGPKQLGPPTLEAPNFDDEDDSDLLTVKEASSSGSNANMNFIKSVMRLDDMFLSSDDKQ